MRSLGVLQINTTMKKLRYLFLLLLPALSMTGCLSNYNYTKYIHNESDQTVIATFQCCGTEEMKSIEVAPGEKEAIHICIYQVAGDGPDCGENPIQISLKNESGVELGKDIQDKSNWYRTKDNLNIECTYVIPATANTRK